MKKKVTTIAPARERKSRVVYSDELLNVILDRVSAGEALSAVCSSDDMPTRKAFFEWVAKDPSIKDKYEFAIQMRADGLVDEMLAIADDGTRDTYIDAEGNEKTDQDVIARSRLRVDARKWLAGKMAPKKYGDRTTLAGDSENPLAVLTMEQITLNPASRIKIG